MSHEGAVEKDKWPDAEIIQRRNSGRAMLDPPIGLGSLGEEVEISPILSMEHCIYCLTMRSPERIHRQLCTACKDLKITFAMILETMGSFLQMMTAYWREMLSKQAERLIEDNVPPEIRIGYKPCQ